VEIHCNTFLPNSVGVDIAEDLDEVIKLSRWGKLFSRIEDWETHLETDSANSGQIHRFRPRGNRWAPSVALRLVEKIVSLSQQNRW